MSRFAVLLVIAAACASGCKSLVPLRVNESPSTPANPEAQSSVNVAPELPPARSGIPAPNQGENEGPQVSPVSEATAGYVPGIAGGDKGRDPRVDSWLICPDLRNKLDCTRQEPLAGDLWSVGCASSHGPQLDNGRLGVGISATPYNCLSEELKAVNAFVKVSQGEARALFVGWSYSGTGTQPYPVPRMQHIWQLSERIRLNAGVMLPNMVDPTFDVSLSIRR